MNCNNPKTDVLIIGAGPTGLILACDLLRRGIQCRIIDKAAVPATTSRALGLQARTLELFETMGLIDQVLKEGGPVLGGSLYNGDQLLTSVGGEAVIQKLQQKRDMPYPMTWIMPQSEIETILISWLHDLGGSVERSCELKNVRQDAETVSATVSTATGAEEIQAHWLVGCDGARSQVRHQLGVSFEGTTYEENFLLADVDVDWKRSRDMTHTWFRPEGMIAVFPFPGGHQWRIFADLIPVTGASTLSVSLELFQQIFQERTGDRVTKISNPTWMSNFIINCRMVDHYRVGRIFLAGDAAHIHSPFGGQGMNTGIQDAYNLAWKLALVISDKAKETLLDTYEEERKPVAKGVLQSTDTNTKVMLSKNPVMRFLRERIMSLVAFQAYLLRRASELDINYRESSLSKSYGQTSRNWFGWQTAPHAGDRAPQGYGCDSLTRTEASLFQEFQGTHFTLLLFSGLKHTSESYASLIKIAEQVGTQLGNMVKTLIIIPDNAKPANLDWTGKILLDNEHELHRLYGAGTPSLYLIRPDGYIGFRGSSATNKSLLDYLAQFCTA